MPFLPTTQQILGSQEVCQLLELSRITAFQERLLSEGVDFKQCYHLIGLGLLKVRIDKVIAPPLRRIQHRDASFLAAVLEPILKLLAISRRQFRVTRSVLR
jgi:hypothetical protein